jgi:hypothetical protein
MAKRKQPAALFEVIHTTPPPPLKIGRAGRSWWFAPRSSAARAEVMRSLHPSMLPHEPQHPQSTATSTCSPEAELRARFADSADVAHEVAVFSADEPEETDMGESPTFHPRPATSASGSEYCAGGFRIDPVRQEVTFRLSYTTAALIAFIGLVLMGLAFVVGKHLAERSGDDPAIQAIRTGQADPGVLNLDHTESPGVTARPAGSDASNSPAPQAQPHAAAASSDAAVATGPVKRTIGLDYLVVQSYPTQKSAQDAADMLTENGVPCTVEHGLRWAPNWYSVVTVAGYPPHSDEGDTLVESIRKAAADQAKLGHRWRFEPQGYQWNQEAKSEE